MPKEETTQEIMEKMGIPPSGKPAKKRLWLKVILWLLMFLAILSLLTASGLYILYRHFSKDLPKISTLADYHPPIISSVYSDDGRKIAEFYEQRRIVIPISDMPDLLIKAFVAAEDSRFYTHKGVDPVSILRAFSRNLKAGTVVQGGSTITQQVIKSFLLTPEKKYSRKIKEAILAYRFDKAFTKEDILYLYLNEIYLGHGAYGVEAAAENYFGKSVKDLGLAECAMLAGLPQAPSEYSPFRHPDMARKRQIYVLSRMTEEGFISEEQSEIARSRELEIKPRRNWYIEKSPHYTEHIRREVEKKYGKRTLLREGLQIHTAVNLEMQAAALGSIEKGLRELDKRQGYRGPIENIAEERIENFFRELYEKDPALEITEGRIATGVVIRVDDKKNEVMVRLGKEWGIIGLEDMKWARKPNPEVLHIYDPVRRPGAVLKVGDVILVRIMERIEEKEAWRLGLEQEPEVQSALMCMENPTGHIKVMVGGKDFRESQFNRAIQSRRQPGSAFKPIIYSAALDKGKTPASVIIDNAIVFEDLERDLKWKPRSYDRKFHGPTLLRKALAKSLNLSSIKLLSEIGVDYVIEYAERMGIQSPLSRDLSIALGSSGVSLLELVRAYSIFANQGEMVTPVFITRIEDRYGKTIFSADLQKTRVIEKTTAYLMTSLLEEVVKSGTGKRANVLGRPVAAKTGTTNNLYDAWFMGYTPRYVAGAWVGFDEARSLGRNETGAGAAAPIWIYFMQEILKNEPIRNFQQPENITFTQIDAKTGLLPNSDTEETIFECFKTGTEPTERSRREVPNIFKD